MNFYRSYPKALERVSILFLGVCIGVVSYAVFLHLHRPPIVNHLLREGTTNYELINPLLACNITSGHKGDQYEKLNKDLRDIVSDEKAQGHATDISIYFHEFTSGGWVGIDENHAYDPASMLKIALMITYFKEAEGSPDVLEQKYTYTNSLNQVGHDISFASSSSLKVGVAYNVNDLLRAMITESDNGATFILLDHVDDAKLTEVYKDLGISSPDNVSGSYTISPKAYSLFFRVLYNATYLDREFSEEAMKMLSETTYTNGLVSGIPSGSVVAHKYGEHVNGVNGGVTSFELHDCGIVYAPNSPYFLCVMTGGASVDDLSSVISRVSRTVYESVGVPKK